MQEQINRLHFMDSMRAILMMMGVVIHSAQVFSPSQSWLIFSQRTSPFMAHIVEIIHSFRMPAFFVVSGYFCLLTLKKYKAAKFIRTRTMRIVVPFFFAATILNTLQTVILVKSGWFRFDPLRYLLSGEYVSHLWFLANLLVYFLVAGLFYGACAGRLRLVIDYLSKLVGRLPVILVVFVMPVFSILIMATSKVGFPLYTSIHGVFDIYSILINAPYFMVGMVLATDKNLLARFSSINPLLIVSMAIGSIYIGNTFSSLSGELWRAVIIYSRFFNVWCMVFLCFYIFYNYFNSSSKILNTLSESSYTVYLFHHILVVAIGLLIIGLNIPVLVGFSALVVLVVAISLVVHGGVVARSRALRYMFNGR